MHCFCCFFLVSPCFVVFIISIRLFTVSCPALSSTWYLQMTNGWLKKKCTLGIRPRVDKFPYLRQQIGVNQWYHWCRIVWCKQVPFGQNELQLSFFKIRLHNANGENKSCTGNKDTFHSSLVSYKATRKYHIVNGYHYFINITTQHHQGHLY